jgi:cytochrome c553
MVAAMEAHYSAAILAHDALLHGELPAFKAQLAEVASQELPATAPEAWKPLHEPLQSAAAAAADASDLPAAATVMASVVLACGTCHASLGAGPVYPAPAPDEADTPLQEEMREHQWGTERLWEGVTGPWDNAWERGAAEIASTRVFADRKSDAKLSEELQLREAALRAIGQEAQEATALDARAAVYGRLLATCGGCHETAGVDFPPPR